MTREAWDTGPTIYMASHGHNPSIDHFDEAHKPAILISYAYLQSWAEKERRDGVCHRHWMMDSGAYTAWTLGKPVVLEEYMAVCRDLLAADPKLLEVIGLDVIGSWRGTKRNVERMWQAGIPAIPVYHLGEPEDVLVGYARDYPKVCVGGVYLLKGREDKRRYVETVFAKTWPCALHALAVSGVTDGLLAPWHSMDSSSAFRGANGYGTWRGFSGTRGQKWQRLRPLPADYDHDVRAEITHYLKGENMLRHRWARQMAEVTARLRAANWRGYEGEANNDDVHQGAGHGAGAAPLA
jgi:hypothetical protein